MRRRSVRVRTTFVATVVVAVALAVALVVVILVTRGRVKGSIESAAEARAVEVAELAAAGSLPGLVPTAGDIVVVQVLGADGTVVGGSSGAFALPPLPPLIALDPASGALETVETDELDDLIEAGIGYDSDGPLYAAAAAETGPAGTSTAVVVAALDVEDFIGELVAVFLVVFPLLLMAVAVITWWVAGRALSPVEALRREAEEVSGSRLDRRLPEPGTGDEIARLAETLNRMLERLETYARRQQRFVADASHELKSPVAAIRTMVEVAAANPGSVGVAELAADVLAEDRRLERLVGDLLTLASSDEDALPLRPTRVDLDDLVRIEVGADGRPDRTVDATRVRPVQAEVDAERFRQLVRNLLDNALRHAASSVWLSLDRDDGRAVLIVADDGPGIPVPDRERVFERFVRLDEARARGEGGTGLGLAVARAIARAHGGEVTVVDSPHPGAAFRVEIPLPAAR